MSYNDPKKLNSTLVTNNSIIKDIDRMVTDRLFQNDIPKEGYPARLKRIKKGYGLNLS